MTSNVCLPWHPGQGGTGCVKETSNSREEPKNPQGGKYSSQQHPRTDNWHFSHLEQLYTLSYPNS